MQKRGGVKISYKKGDRKLIKNYRPITLLNIDIKIITKTLADRLANIIPKLVHANQTCIPGRHIENNIFLTQDLIDHANLTNRNLAIIFLDQEKAFDRMSHKFIFKILERFGFGAYFIKWVKTICFDTKSFVKVNGYQTFEFSIERGVRQGCPLSPLLYVLTAEALSSAIRKNILIKGYTYKMLNLCPLEYKISQYADDTSIAVTDTKSIVELFKMLEKYQKATNAKVNKDKTEGLWVGNWKGRLDRPLNLKWTSDTIKSLGIIIGNKVGANGHLALGDLNFAEQIEKIKMKLNFWKGKGLSLLSRVKVINIFVLSRLWYRSNIWDISKNMLDTLNRMVRNFIWEGKMGARVRQEVLQLSYEKGGLQLVDIGCKMQVQRIKRIFYLLNQDSNNIERFLADSLIGDLPRHKQYGLSFGLFNNKIRIQSVKSCFYKNALKIIMDLNLVNKPSNINSIKNEPLFYNSMFIDQTSNGPFKLARFKNQLPKNIAELQSFPHSREHEINDIIAKLRTCIRSLNFTDNDQNSYAISVNNTLKCLDLMDFKNIYLILLNKKIVIKEWENRWLAYLQVNDIEWVSIWQKLHSTNNYYTISAIWEMFHLNFWSNYRANERCHLCNLFEDNITHIINGCRMIREILAYFNIRDVANNLIDLTFGTGVYGIDIFLLHHIKAVVFRSRFKTFTNQLQCKKSLITKCIYNMKFDLISKFNIAKSNNKITAFINTCMDFGQNEPLWSLNENQISFHFPAY